MYFTNYHKAVWVTSPECRLDCKDVRTERGGEPANVEHRLKSSSEKGRRGAALT